MDLRSYVDKTVTKVGATPVKQAATEYVCLACEEPVAGDSEECDQCGNGVVRPVR